MIRSEIYDITPAITERLAVWPGDTPVRREILCDLTRGDSITLSTLHSTVHLGAHADAPNHYGVAREGIGERSLTPYLGKCQVIRVNAERSHLLRPEDVPTSIVAERILFATGTFPDATDFNEDFAALSPELVKWCAGQGVLLIGMDTPSVDPFSSKDLPAHHVFLEHDLAILEGLVLKEVPAGIYELIALPLRLIGFDASPVRAILRPWTQ